LVVWPFFYGVFRFAPRRVRLYADENRRLAGQQAPVTVNPASRSIDHNREETS
jgi:hypothetical protein